MILFIISFIAGVLTVLAPCILPLLPVIVGGSISSNGKGVFNRRRAFTIVLSLGVSVVLFTILLKVSTLLINVPEDFWKWISGSIVIFIGLATVFPSIWENQLLAKLNAKSNRLIGAGHQKNNFIGDIIIGSALGPVFSTCSPTYFIVLATVLPVNPFLGMVYLFAYAFGLCLALLIVAVVGQKILHKLGIAADPNGWFKKVLGIIFILVGIAIIGGLDKKTQIFLLEAGIFDVTKIEQKLLEKGSKSINDTKEDGKLNMVKPEIIKSEENYLSIKQKQARYRRAPELSSIDGYINTDGESITLDSLKGKVVLLDIWTYSCINCQRTIPYINDWYSKYKDQGLEIIGLHTPEFAFEKVQSNVQKAVENFDITYPVVLDNDYSTWNALGNQYWPRKYLIDVDGFIVYDHIGEGSYQETEKAIQDALREKAYKMGLADKVSDKTSLVNDVISIDPSKVKSPEVYFGALRNSLIANGKNGLLGEQAFFTPNVVLFNKLYFSGIWNFTDEYAENKDLAEAIFNYEAKNVYMTAKSIEGVEVGIYQDDVLIKKLTIKDATLYPLIEDIDYGNHTLRIVIPKAGLQIFTLTFG